MLLIILASFIINLKIENELSEAFSKIKTESIQNLEHKSNENFSKNGIENIGENLKSELIKMNIDNCDFNVTNDGLFFFQNKTICIINSHKCLRINTRYVFLKSIFRIE